MDLWPSIAHLSAPGRRIPHLFLSISFLFLKWVLLFVPTQVEGLWTEGVNYFIYTSSMVGHHQKTVVVDLKSLPVQGRMCLQCLVMQESVFLKIPLIDNRKLRLHLPGIRHHYEYLSKSKNPWLKNWTPTIHWTSSCFFREAGYTVDELPGQRRANTDKKTQPVTLTFPTKDKLR